MTRVRDDFYAAMRRAAQIGPWVAVDRVTVRHTWTRPTPEPMRRWPSLWPGGKPIDYGPNYDTHVFVTATAGPALLRICRAPWLGCTDQAISFRLAMALLEHPDWALDTPIRRG